MAIPAEFPLTPALSPKGEGALLRAFSGIPHSLAPRGNTYLRHAVPAQEHGSKRNIPFVLLDSRAGAPSPLGERAGVRGLPCPLSGISNFYPSLSVSPTHLVPCDVPVGDDLNDRGSFFSNAGFTLIEMIAALALMAVLTAVFGMGLVAAMQSFDFSRTNVEVVQKGQLAMARMSRELSEVTDVINLNIGPDPFIIYERVEDSSGVPVVNRLGLHYNSADHSLRLYLNPPDTNTLDASTISQGRVLVDGIQTFTLQYFNGKTPLTTWPFDLRQLSTIQINLELNRPDAPAQPQRFNTLVFLRNTPNQGGAR